MNTKIVSILLALFLQGSAIAQGVNVAPSSFERGGEFRYRKSKTDFPENLVGLKRSTITDYGPGGISVAYVPTDGNAGRITVYLYPDELTNDYDAQVSFHAAAEAMMSTSGSPGNPSKYVVILDCKSFKVPGLAGEIIRPDSSELNYLALFQCGKWALKIRLTTIPSHRDVMLGHVKELLRALRPEEIVSRFPFNPDTFGTLIDRGSLKDSVFAACTLIGAYAELQWTEGNVSTIERRAGFPGLYLGAHYAALKLMLSTWQYSKFKGDSQTKQFMQTLELLDTSRFMKEFIMDKYDGLLLPAATDTLKMDEYNAWKLKNSIPLDPTKRYFTIYYEK
jgi:hypothetical protein